MARNVQVKKKSEICINETFSKDSGDPYTIKVNCTLGEGMNRFILPGSLNKQFFEACFAQQQRIEEIGRIDFSLTLDGKHLYFAYEAQGKKGGVHQTSFPIMEKAIGLSMLQRYLRTQIEKSPRMFDRMAVCAK